MSAAPPAPPPAQPAEGPKPWHQQEMAEIKARRQALGRPEDGLVVGLALSGGGIRSASVCLGVLQALDQAKLLDRVDYLSTVSGGGYTGVGWLSWLSRKGHGAGFPYARGEALNQLRDRASYLMPPGLWPKLLVVAMLLRRLAGHMVGLLSWLVLWAAALAALRLLVAGVPGSTDLPADIARAGLLALLGMILLVGFATCAIETSRSTQRSGTGCIARVLGRGYDWYAAVLIGGMALLALLAAQPWLHDLAARHLWLPDQASLWPRLERLSQVAGAVFALLTALGIGARLRGRWFGLATTILALGTLVLIYLLALGGAFLLLSLTPPTGSMLAGDWRPATAAWGTVALAFLAAGVLIWLSRFISPNATSMHGFYRERLCDAFLPKPVGNPPPAAAQQAAASGAAASPGDGGPVGAVKLSQLSPRLTRGPFLVVNATVNGVTEASEARRGRSVMPLVMTPLAIHCTPLGECTAEEMQQADPRFDAGSAMALSAAAVGGNQDGMGSAARLLRGLLNLRTARWMFSPKRAREAGGKPIHRHPPPFLLLRELTGQRLLDRNQSFILVSDGGHYENLGITALLHRRCDVIVVVDAEADPAMVCNGLGVATRLARLDVLDKAGHQGTQLAVDPAQLGYDEATRAVKQHFAEGTVTYPAAWGKAEAKVLYIKASVSGDEAVDIMEYRWRNKDFPQETTADQFFSEEQFEAYRALGQHIGERVVATSNLKTWL